MARKELSGIERAIAVFGTHAAFAKALSEAGHRRIRPYTIGVWLNRGYIPAWRLKLVSDLTGIPGVDLMRQTPRKTRSDKGVKKKSAEAVTGSSVAEDARFRWWSVKTSAGTD